MPGHAMFTRSDRAQLTRRLLDLVHEKVGLERDLKSAHVRNAALERALTETLGTPTVVRMETVAGVLTVVLSNGVVRQWQPTAVRTATETTFGHAWVDITPVPATAAAVIADALAECVGPADPDAPSPAFTAWLTEMRGERAS